MTQAAILIAEDEFIVARDLADRLTAMGYAVAGIATSAPEAVRLAGELRPDLVLMDVRLRDDTDGVVAAEEVRRHADVPVVFLTAYADDATLARARRTEPYGYILKPFEERELRTVIEMALAKHRADVLLRHSEARFKAFMDNSPTLAFMKDSASRYVYANRAWERQFPEPRSDWLGRSDNDFFPAETAELFRSHDRQVLETGGTSQVVETGPIAGGEIRTWLTTKFPLTDAAGAPVVGGTSQDVTEMMRLQEQLRQAQKMEALGRLAGGVAHDFNNLLTVITGYASLMLRSMTPEHPFHELAAGVLQCGDQAADLTRQLLAFSRKQVLRPRTLDLNRVVAGMERMLTRLLGGTIAVVTELAPDLGPIRADPGQLEQVIVNLAVNARDAMPDGGTLTFKTASVAVRSGDAGGELAPGEYRQLIVRDTGHGMDDETRRRVFEPFFTTKGLGKGTGLGLATVYGIVTASGGHVEVASEVGRGTTFTIYLPAAAEAASPPPTTQAEPEFPRGTETVLLAEDLAPVRAAVAQVLRSSGYTVLEAASGGDAIEAASRHDGALDLLVSDLIMPGMGGEELAARLTERQPGLKVLFLSGYPGRDVTEPGASLAHELVMKPFMPLDLARKVREILDRRGGR